jgi:hypothetical protein
MPGFIVVSAADIISLQPYVSRLDKANTGLAKSARRPALVEWWPRESSSERCARYRDRDAGGDGGVHDEQDGKRGGADIAEDELQERTGPRSAPRSRAVRPLPARTGRSQGPEATSRSRPAAGGARERVRTSGSRTARGLHDSVRLRQPARARTGACRSASGRPQG